MSSLASAESAPPSPERQQSGVSNMYVGHRFSSNSLENTSCSYELADEEYSKPSCSKERADEDYSMAETGKLCRWYPVSINGTVKPCKRSLHSASVYNDSVLVFGGYDGLNRVNDLYKFDLKTKTWTKESPGGASRGVPPSPRDRHTAVVHGKCFYVFGGYDGSSRVNDFFKYDLERKTWSEVLAVHGTPPTPRHSHAAVVYGDSMFVFGGYDGSYRKDFYEFNFKTSTWTQVPKMGRVPHARYRTACVVHGDCMVLFGGHDGAHHLDDTAVFNFTTRMWHALKTRGSPPRHRDSHVAVANGNCFYIFGGSTGSAMNDFWELNMKTAEWRLVPAVGTAPCPRFCHVAVSHKDSMLVFGGYDGADRLNDFVRFNFGPDVTSTCAIPPSSITNDLGEFVNNELGSDISFIVEGKKIYAHKILCMRCPYLRSMLCSNMKESMQKEIVLQEIKYESFLSVLQYLYTDQVNVNLDNAMELFQIADQFGIDRMRMICESCILSSVNIENAASVLLAADATRARDLRSKCMTFILQNFDAVSKTKAFTEMGRLNVELVLEILRKR